MPAWENDDLVAIPEIPAAIPLPHLYIKQASIMVYSTVPHDDIAARPQSHKDCGLPRAEACTRRNVFDPNGQEGVTLRSLPHPTGRCLWC